MVLKNLLRKASVGVVARTGKLPKWNSSRVEKWGKGREWYEKFRAKD